MSILRTQLKYLEGALREMLHSQNFCDKNNLRWEEKQYLNTFANEHKVSRANAIGLHLGNAKFCERN